MKKTKDLFLLCSLLLLASCGGTTSGTGDSTTDTTPVVQPQKSATIKVTSQEEENILISPEDVKITDTLHSIEDKKFYNTQVLPSIGDVKLLVIPILIPYYDSFDYYGFEESVSTDDRKEIVRNDIQKTFFGKPEDTGWQSVSSFYKESSFGKLNLSGTVTEWFDASTVEGISTPDDITIQKTTDLVENAVQWAIRTQSINPADYDYDGDGFIDGVWCVYSAEDYAKNGPYTDDSNYWAYTSWGNQDKEADPDTNEYYYNLFGWASYDFMYEGYGNQNVDAHTFIHETGHFLGLNDYYSDRSMYNPLGKTDMMDANIIDHNSYSKMLLGWTKPYVVKGNATIDLLPMTKENNLIVVLSDSQEIQGQAFDPFSEYMLVEYYTNDGLNQKDSLDRLSQDRPLAPQDAGVRIYHIDNRKFLATVENGVGTAKEYTGQTIDDTHRLITPITNAISYNQYYYNFNLAEEYFPYDEIRMIEASGKNTFSTGGFQTSKSFFKEGDVFSFDRYSSFFLHENTLNNHDTFSASINVTSLVDTEAN